MAVELPPAVLAAFDVWKDEEGRNKERLQYFMKATVGTERELSERGSSISFGRQRLKIYDSGILRG